MSLDRQQIKSFTDKTESTLADAPNHSAGMLLLALEKRYPALSLSDCLNELKSLADTPEKKAAIDNIEAKAKEAAVASETFTLYMNGKETKHTFLIKDALPLVFAATKDAACFSHAYPGNHQEKLALALREYPDRLNMLFDCLQKIHTHSLCHTGTRNELVFSLNGTFSLDGKEPICLLEDATLSAIMLIRKIVGQHVASKDKTEDDTKKIVLAWIANGDCGALLDALGLKNIVMHELMCLLAKNGLNPYEPAFQALLIMLVHQVEFAYDHDYYPPIFQAIHDIFAASDKPLEAALSAMRHFILHEYDFKSARHKMQIMQFNRHLQAYLSLKKYSAYLRLTNEDLFEAVNVDCANYFAKDPRVVTITPPVIMQRQVRLKETVAALKSSSLYDQIENFFAHWFQNDCTNLPTQRKKLYRLLITDDFKHKIILSDADLRKLIKANGTLDLTPYLINRLFLQAILQKSSDRSQLFSSVLTQTLAFVKANFNGTANNEDMADNLKYHSYPRELISSLENPQRHPCMVVPDNVKTMDELELILPFFTADEFYDIYKKLKNIFDPLLIRKMQMGNIFALNVPSNVLHQCVITNAKKVIMNTPIFYTYFLFFLNNHPTFSPSTFIEKVFSACSNLDAHQKVLNGMSLCDLLTERGETESLQIIETFNRADTKRIAARA